MSSIAITGIGAVSPAGWGLPALMDAIDTEARPPVSELSRERKSGPPVVTPVLRVPPAPAGVARHPRLRRVSPISKFAAAAAMEALGAERVARVAAGDLHLGVICALTNGCVNYSNRFFGEVRENPSVASPILFPETVFNAPASHLSALFSSTGPNDTLLGDAVEVFTAMEIATEWLESGGCDGVLVVAPEEVDWLSAEALQLYSRNHLAAEGAAAIFLEPGEGGPRLLALPDPVRLKAGCDHSNVLQRLAALSRADNDGRTLLMDSRRGVVRFDRAEEEAFRDWAGPRLSLKKFLGEAFAASAGWQLVAAVSLLKRGAAERAYVSATTGRARAASCLLGSESRAEPRR